MFIYQTKDFCHTARTRRKGQVEREKYTILNQSKARSGVNRPPATVPFLRPVSPDR